LAAIDTLAATPHGLTDPPAPPVPVKTLSRWTLFLGDIASGTPLQEAMLKHFMKRADIEACVRSSAEERVRWNDARVAAKRSSWSAFDLEEIIENIAGGMPVMKAIETALGSNYTETKRKDFLYLCTADPEINDLFTKALASRAVNTSEEITAIADGDGKGDYLDNGKGGLIPDNAKVNRDKLRVDTRYRLMASWNARMFGEGKGDVQVNVQVNHAERLEQARQRRDGRVATKAPEKLDPAVIEAAFRTLPAPATDKGAFGRIELPSHAARETNAIQALRADEVKALTVEREEWDDVVDSRQPTVATESTEWREEN
jgi:hypothetical protein